MGSDDVRWGAPGNRPESSVRGEELSSWGCGSKSGIGSHDGGIDSVGEFYIESVHESQVVAELPRPGEEWGYKVTLQRGSGNTLESGGDLTDSEVSGSLKAS